MRTYAVTHTTRYSYSEPVSLSHNEAYLSPRDTSRQRALAHEIDVHPRPSWMASHVDYFGNVARSLSVEGPHVELVITARTRVELHLGAPIDPRKSAPWREARETLASGAPQHRPALAFRYPSPNVPVSTALAEYAAASFRDGMTLAESAIDLGSRIHADFEYIPGSTTVGTPTEQVFRERRGVCQDFAHLQIACLRSLGFAARYVSGYLETIPPPGQTRLVGADASHAWLSVYDPRLGWIDIDPTNDLVPEDRHITIAWGRDYSDVVTVKGVVLGGGQHALSVSVDVAPLA